MERTTETTAEQALGTARQFLSRWRDGYTATFAEDLAQEAAIEALDRATTVRQPERWPAFVRTVSRRVRYHAVMAHLRDRCVSLELHREVAVELAADETSHQRLFVGGEWMSMRWCLEQLDRAFRRLGPLNQCLMRGYYEGFSCSELADRYDLLEESIKVRLYRCRNRIRKELEERVSVQSADRSSGSR